MAVHSAGLHQAENCPQTMLHSDTSSRILSADHATQWHIKQNTVSRPHYTVSHQAEYCQQTTLHSVTSSQILSADHATQCHIKPNIVSRPCYTVTHQAEYCQQTSLQCHIKHNTVSRPCYSVTSSTILSADHATQCHIKHNTVSRPRYTVSHQAQHCQQTTLHSVTSSWILQSFISQALLSECQISQRSITAHNKFPFCMEMLSPWRGTVQPLQLPARDLTFWQRCFLRFGSPGMWHVSLGDRLLTFWRNVVPSLSRVRQSKTNSHTVRNVELYRYSGTG